VTETHLWEFHSLFLALRDEGEPGFGADVLGPWLDERPQVPAELHSLGQAEAAGAKLDDEVSWGLYAFSRITDILISPHQPVNDDPALLNWTNDLPWWRGPQPAPSAWSQFRERIGATLVQEDAFHPFFHEIVSVVPSEDPDERPVLVEELWPGALIDSLLLVRSGVVVRAGANVLDPDVASRSCLYASWYRRNRRVYDLSHGWGHNSQWRTDARRDYLLGDELQYNVDARFHAGDNAADRRDLTAEERRTLLRYRHSLTVDWGTEQWPWDDFAAEPR
jgi:hypothetical protein